jgi:aarF domain-containing kinase
MGTDVAIQEVMSSELGHDWRQKFGSFDLVPFAAASIGQVHAATLPDGTDVAVKVQFPGVANSIDADIGNIRFLLSFSALLPRGLYLENTLKTMRTELAQECDYEYEAASARTYKTLLGSLPQFAAPKIVDTLSTRQVLTMEMMHGVPVTKLLDHPQDLRDRVSTCSFSLFSRGAGLSRVAAWLASNRAVLARAFRIRFHANRSKLEQLLMEPKHAAGASQLAATCSNIMSNSRWEQLELVDFGASQAYRQPFIGLYRKLLRAAIQGDRSACLQISHEIGYLTPDDTEVSGRRYRVRSPID